MQTAKQKLVFECGGFQTWGVLFDRAVFHKHAMKIETVDFMHAYLRAHVYSVVLRMHKCIRIISKLT